MRQLQTICVTTRRIPALYSPARPRNPAGTYHMYSLVKHVFRPPEFLVNQKIC